MNSKWNIYFKYLDPKTQDKHCLFSRNIGIEQYAYICYDKKGMTKSCIQLKSEESARKHFIKKTGQDPFQEVVIK